MTDRNRPQKHVARARPVLLSAERLGVAAVARGAQISRPAVWRWQQRYAEAGVEGLLRDKTRKPTTTLFAALNVLDGTVLGRCMQRHRHQEFIRFLGAVEAAVPAGKLVHVIRYPAERNDNPQPFTWTKTASQITAKLNQLNASLH